MKKGVVAYIFLLSSLSFFGINACTDQDDKEVPVELCADGIDNDGDGLIDCEDLDCETSPECIAEICDDGLDNDGDGLTDCEDPECVCE
ncbi:hypothetical protein [Robiginitalea aurantiaca]|uniref:EF-hand domain-containing protein n=1 Tax=Robiginitalea aurantiaca TaxID=3056915 RepID=A0ABT7WCI1_9FLAO|nr:hypothetical protein [Robiginitalea aurantiaca]MDM9630611.1 hypothetical protein [Robiginitalea aurantiaca]